VTLIAHHLSIGIFSPRSCSPYTPGNDRDEQKRITPLEKISLR
jgi:hypothetical protein